MMNLVQQRWYHTATRLGGSAVLLAGGQGGAGGADLLDSAGICEPITDTIPPTTTAALVPAANANGWNNTAVTVNLTAADNDGGSGVSRISYAVAGAERIPNTSVPGAAASIPIDAEGVSVVTFFASDNGGNFEPPMRAAVNIDMTRPVITVATDTATLWPPNGRLVPVTVSGTFSDSLSGVDPASLTFQVIDSLNTIQPTGAISAGSDGAYSFTVMLQAGQRGSRLAGRQYQIIVSGRDKARNATSASTVVAAPRDFRR